MVLEIPVVLLMHVIYIDYKGQEYQGCISYLYHFDCTEYATTPFIWIIDTDNGVYVSRLINESSYGTSL